jgi:uncharacterized Zn-binding protein involved in type VI secretion
MPSGVRLGDSSAGHCFEPRGNIVASPNVFINGIAAHRVGDGWPTHTCGTDSHPSITAQGSPNVFINGIAAARVGDKLDCGDIIAQGSPNVFIN